MIGSMSAARRCEQVERILAARKEENERRAAEADALLCEQRLRLARVASLLTEAVRPVLDEYAGILRDRGLRADVTQHVADGEPPRLALRVVQPAQPGHRPPTLLDGTLTFTVATDLEHLLAREELWRLLRGGSRQEVGAVPLDDVRVDWVEERVLEFLRHLLLDDDVACAELPVSSRGT